MTGLKADNPVALANCFAIALAAEEGTVLLTGDPEIIERADQLPCDVKDLRAVERGALVGGAPQAAERYSA